MLSLCSLGFPPPLLTTSQNMQKIVTRPMMSSRKMVPGHLFAAHLTQGRMNQDGLIAEDKFHIVLVTKIKTGFIHPYVPYTIKGWWNSTLNPDPPTSSAAKIRHSSHVLFHQSTLFIFLLEPHSSHQTWPSSNHFLILWAIKTTLTLFKWCGNIRGMAAEFALYLNIFTSYINTYYNAASIPL